MGKVVASISSFAGEQAVNEALEAAKASGAPEAKIAYVDRDANGKPIRVHLNLPDSAAANAATAINQNPGIPVVGSFPVTTTAAEFNTAVDAMTNNAEVSSIGAISFSPNGFSQYAVEASGLVSGKGLWSDYVFGSYGEVSWIEPSLQALTDYKFGCTFQSIGYNFSLNNRSLFVSTVGSSHPTAAGHLLLT